MIASGGRMSTNAIEKLLTELQGTARKQIVVFRNGLNVAAAVASWP